VLKVVTVSRIRERVSYADVTVKLFAGGNLTMRKPKLSHFQRGRPRRLHPRAGVSTLDYILLLGIILPLVAFIVPAGKRIIELSYEMICTLVAWPFM
jgi:hypothetical protein